jgi:hypothetical protein
MIRMVMNNVSGITSVPLYFLSPRRRVSWTAIRTGKVTSIIKINFHIARNDIIFVSG